MQLPFTVDQFYGVFRDYNTTFWPAQLVLLVLAMVAVILVVFPRRWTGIGVSAILTFFWAWMGIAYHLVFFTSINPLAYVFAIIFIIAAVIFFWLGIVRKRLEFYLVFGANTFIGAILIVYALVIYPAWSVTAGHPYPQLPTFGLPCPTTIFTIGLLCCLVRPYPRIVLVVPVLWALVGGQAAFLLGVPQDMGLLVAGVAGIVLMLRAKTVSTN